MAWNYLKVEDVQKALGYGRAKAYLIIAQLNAELAAEGYMTRPGWIPADYFKQRFNMRGE